MKLTSKVTKKRRVVTSNNNIINIEKQVNKIKLLIEDKKRGDNTTTRKTKCKYKRVKALKLGTGGLLETIEDFL